jgi:hypothetical protein
MSMGRYYVSELNSELLITQMVAYMNMENHGEMVLSTSEMVLSTGEKRITGENPVPMPLCAPKIPDRLTRARTRAFAVRGW